MEIIDEKDTLCESVFIRYSEAKIVIAEFCADYKISYKDLIKKTDENTNIRVRAVLALRRRLSLHSNAIAEILNMDKRVAIAIVKGRGI